mgnify:CR=1 FL=1
MDSRAGNVLALDVGGRRIGVALAHTVPRLPSPLTTILHEDDIAAAIKRLVHEYQEIALVVGLPRGLNGQETAQTKVVREFGARIEPIIGVPLYWQDEAVTSAKAEAELTSRGKPYTKADIDALSATYILEDFLRDNEGKI